jgi:hypothetical protein
VEFGDGTPVQRDASDKRGKTLKVWDVADSKAKNIRWKTEMPCWGNTQPIVVGNRVFTKAEPNLLVCVDAETGKILWTQSANAWELAGVDAKVAAQAQAMWELAMYGEPQWWAMASESTMSDVLPKEKFSEVLGIYKRAVQPRILAGLKELDPKGNYEKVAKSLLVELDGHVAKFAGEGKKETKRKVCARRSSSELRL